MGSDKGGSLVQLEKLHAGPYFPDCHHLFAAGQGSPVSHIRFQTPHPPFVLRSEIVMGVVLLRKIYCGAETCGP